MTLLPETSSDIGGSDQARVGDYTPIFRAVKVGPDRRGIRLEKIYWNVLKELSVAEGRTLGDIVHQSEAEFREGANITSVLRVMCLQWLRAQLDAVQSQLGVHVIDSLVQVSPVPTFALTEDKRILYSNQPFLLFIQSKFPRVSAGTMGPGLRLSLEVQIQELVRTLKENGNRPISTGFILAVEDQRVRGRLNAVIAPSKAQTIILGYVSSS